MIVSVMLSLCFGFVGVFFIAFYSEDTRLKPFSLAIIFKLWIYRIYFLLLCVFSLCVLMWFGIDVIYVIMMLLLLLGLIDIKCLAVPDTINFLLLLVCIGYVFIDSQHSFVQRVLMGFGVGGVFFALKILYQSLVQKEIIGEADIIVLSSIGIAFGALNAFISVFLGSVAALVYAIFLAIFYRVNLAQLKLPFCFFIFLGTTINLAWLSFVIHENP
ncbi:prepilin peptidase [Helicobacter hepaticus]|uniref:Type IV prepilin peptidase HopD n=1 Tax=Helicobacter hepaticus (strain ATCC 51449 / 3B1) TaxID=235279 RepID=Q7VIK2_HELHP|nr:prepilin peptidase [Helicobacter hepaticus]AAP77200.1 type IV prepilin peptidase HopD [Helicobacter hepaticus ATCC 51449]